MGLEPQLWAWELAVELLQCGSCFETRFFGGSLLVSKARSHGALLQAEERNFLIGILLGVLSNQDADATRGRVSLSLVCLAIRESEGTGCSQLLSHPQFLNLSLDRIVQLLQGTIAVSHYSLAYHF